MKVEYIVMLNIFTFFNNYKIYEVPNRFSYQHVLLLIFAAVYIFLIVFLLRKASFKTQKSVLLGINIACIIIFSLRMFLGWDGSRIYQDGSKTSLLPFELCNLNIFVTFLAIIINRKLLNNYLYFVSLIGGMIPLLIFPDIHMITNGNNLFHYMFFDYYFIHTQLVMIPVAMISWHWFKPDIKVIPFVVLMTLGIHFFCFISSAILRNFASFKNANYMYTISDNNLPVLKTLHQIIPLPYLYQLPLIIPIVVLFYLMGLPFYLKNKRRLKNAC